MTCPIGSDIARAAKILKAGGLVALPTETVYGLGANALDTSAVVRVFEAKNRPRFDPIIVHVANITEVERLTASVPQNAYRLAEQFWPGPLTLVLPKSDVVPDLVTSGLDSVAIRVPDHPLALNLLQAAELPIAAPSANPFGKLSPTEAEHVAEQLGDRIDYILDGGPCRVGVESTVLHVADNSATLLRPGGLSVEEIEQVIGPVILPSPLGDSDESAESAQLSPGMLPQHYAPKTRLLVAPNAQSIIDNRWRNSAGCDDSQLRIGLLLLSPMAETTRVESVEVLSATGDLTEAATRFFATLRQLDKANLDVIIAHRFPEEGLGRAMNDRLHRAANT